MNVRRILAIRPRALGDVVLTTPALRALRRGHPAARLDVLTEPAYAPLLEPLPEVDRVWTLARRGESMLAMAATLRRARYDLVVDFFGNARSALLTLGSGAPRTVGWDVRGRRHAYRTRVTRTGPEGVGAREYAAASHARLATAAGGIGDGLQPHLALTEGARAAADAALERAGVGAPERAVGLVAAGTWGPKTWPLANAGVLARRLAAAGWEVVGIFGPGEDGAAERLSRIAPEVRVLPRVDVLGLAAVIARLAAVVGTDSGPRHLAVTLGVPTFAWFGPTRPEHWTPPDDARHGYWASALPCRGCGRTRCPHWNCLPALEPGRAATLVLDHLQRHVRSSADLGAAAGA